MRFMQTLIFLSLIFAFSGNVAAETYDQPPFWNGGRVSAERKLFQGRHEKTMTNSSELIDSLSDEMRPCDTELQKKIGIMFANYNLFQQRMSELLDDDPIWEREKKYLEALLIEMTVNVDFVKQLLNEYTRRDDLLGVIKTCEREGDITIVRLKEELEHPVEIFLQPNTQEIVPPKVPSH